MSEGIAPVAHQHSAAVRRLLPFVTELTTALFMSGVGCVCLLSSSAGGVSLVWLHPCVSWSASATPAALPSGVPGAPLHPVLGNVFLMFLIPSFSEVSEGSINTPPRGSGGLCTSTLPVSGRHSCLDRGPRLHRGWTVWSGGQVGEPNLCIAPGTPASSHAPCGPWHCQVL